MSEMNIINQLYSHHYQETLKKVRKSEGLEHRFVKHRGAHVFNLWFLSEKVIPSGCRIKFKSNNFVESSITRKAVLALINNRIRQCYKKISKLREGITGCKRNIPNFIDNEHFLQQVYDSWMTILRDYVSLENYATVGELYYISRNMLFCKNYIMFRNCITGISHIYDFKGYWYRSTGEKGTGMKRHQGFIWSYLLVSEGLS